MVRRPDARRFIPIIASVSEHQPTTWATYVFDLHLLPFTAPAGLYLCFKWAPVLLTACLAQLGPASCPEAKGTKHMQSELMHKLSSANALVLRL
jgi:hypothetical protein